MPDQHVGGAAPVEHVKNGSVRSLLDQLIAAVLLRCSQKLCPSRSSESRCRKPGSTRSGTVIVLVAGRDSARGSILRIRARPHVGLHAASRWRRERGAPYRRLAIFPLGVRRGLRFQPEGLSISRPSASRDVKFLKGITAGLEVRRFRLRFLGLGGRCGLRRTSCHGQ